MKKPAKRKDPAEGLVWVIGTSTHIQGSATGILSIPNSSEEAAEVTASWLRTAIRFAVTRARASGKSKRRK